MSVKKKLAKAAALVHSVASRCDSVKVQKVLLLIGTLSRRVDANGRRKPKPYESSETKAIIAGLEEHGWNAWPEIWGANARVLSGRTPLDVKWKVRSLLKAFNKDGNSGEGLTEAELEILRRFAHKVQTGGARAAPATGAGPAGQESQGDE